MSSIILEARQVRYQYPRSLEAIQGISFHSGKSSTDFPYRQETEAFSKRSAGRIDTMRVPSSRYATRADQVSATRSHSMTSPGEVPSTRQKAVVGRRTRSPSDPRLDRVRDDMLGPYRSPRTWLRRYRAYDRHMSPFEASPRRSRAYEDAPTLRMPENFGMSVRMDWSASHMPEKSGPLLRVARTCSWCDAYAVSEPLPVQPD